MFRQLTAPTINFLAKRSGRNVQRRVNFIAHFIQETKKKFFACGLNCIMPPPLPNPFFQAKAVAHESKAKFFNISASALTSKWVSKTSTVGLIGQ